jgi:NAD(P)-dependent dehydrogenase (short-subunit alcohol dehydrogenase family)
MDRSTWLITGASSGLGYALAEYVLERGDQVVAAARTLEPMAALTERYPDAGLALTLDVTDPQQRADAISHAEARFGAIDVLVNNAGIDFIGAIEEQEEKDYRAQFEVNFFAAAALLRQVLPGMRTRGRGTIINISSMDGIASLPVNGWYASSKFALEGLTEALWQELEPIGLRAFLVEPGSFRTGLETRTNFSGTTIDDYAATSGAFREMLKTITPEMWPGDPTRAAAAIYHVVNSDEARHWVILGSDAGTPRGSKEALGTDVRSQPSVPLLLTNRREGERHAQADQRASATQIQLTTRQLDQGRFVMQDKPVALVTGANKGIGFRSPRISWRTDSPSSSDRATSSMGTSVTLREREVDGTTRAVGLSPLLVLA